MKVSRQNYLKTSKTYRPFQVLIWTKYLEEEDKKMEETEEEFKSISSADVKMDKDGSKDINILKDADSSSRQEDIIMEEENEDFLGRFKIFIF